MWYVSKRNQTQREHQHQQSNVHIFHLQCLCYVMMIITYHIIKADSESIWILLGITDIYT